MNRAGLDLIKSFEGLRLKAYRCPAGVPTIGYGATGPGVRIGMTWTEDEAHARLVADVARFEQAVAKALTVPANENQFAAMVSLAFNIGTGGFARSSVLRRHNARDFTGAADAFLLWNKGGGRVLPGLVRRRKAERDLYLMAARMPLPPDVPAAQPHHDDLVQVPPPPLPPDIPRKAEPKPKPARSILAAILAAALAIGMAVLGGIFGK
jgi:GH24 family phage-related lysozyme (muramidase)